MELTEVATSSYKSSENLQTSATTHIETTNQIEIISTTSISKSKPTDWVLIGSLIGLMSLLALLGSCCFCYHCFWSAAARRRRQQQQEDKHRPRYKPASEIGTDLTKISHPPKANQIHDIDTDRAKSSNNNNQNSPRIKTSSSNKKNIIRPETTENSTIDKPLSLLSRPFSLTNEDNSSELKQDTDSLSDTNNSNENRVKSTVNVIRILNTRRCKSMINERKIRQPISSKVLVTHIKK